MKKILSWGFILFITALLAACGRGAEETPTPTLVPAEAPTEAPEETPAEPAFAQAAVDEIVNITWQWADLVKMEPASQSLVANPGNYTIVFQSDGNFTVQADCNSGSGTYTVDGVSMTLVLGPMTLAECGPDSLNDSYLALLNDVGSFGMQDGVLVLASQDENTQARFTNGGPAGPPSTGFIELDPLAPEALIDINWQLISLYETAPASQSLVPDPQNYNVVFREDGTLEVQADCNTALGTYETNNDQMSILLGPTTLAECAPESLSSTFLEWLGQVTAYGGHEGRLILVTGDKAGYLDFQNSGQNLQETQTCAWVDMGSVTIDTMQLLDSTQTNCLPGTPYNDTQPPGPSGLPEHVQINFGVENVHDVQPIDPILYIIPVSEYEELWNASGNPAVANTTDDLSTLLRSQPESIPASGVPILPYERLTGLNDLALQGQSLDIQMGFGLRMIGRFAQDPSPVTSDDPQLFYIYQGFTDDGRYLISFFHPVSTDTLLIAADVSDEERGRVESNYQNYLEDKVEELNALQASDWEPELTLLDEVINSLEFKYAVPADGPGLTNNLWLWSGLIETEPASQSVITDPQNYTLIFLPDGSINIVADCNSGVGSYTLFDTSMSIEVGLLTRIACERGSLSDQFVSLLAQVSAYRFDQNQLILNLGEDDGSMLFTFGGPVIGIPDVPDDAPRATTLEPINVRSGPGLEYPSYGITPAGARAEVVGVSEDGGWWVVKLPTEFAGDGQGWVSAEFVEVFNVEGVPVIPTPPLGDVELTPPESDMPTATALEPINVRSGPGVQYPSYGIAPAGATAEIVGVSPDELWWVVKIPAALNPDEQGWVSAAYVEATNAEDVPVITPPLP